MDSMCLSSDHNITSNCGTCHIASTTTAICSDFHLPSVCTFSVKRIVCGQVGMANNPITVTLKGIYCNIFYSIHR